MSSPKGFCSSATTGACKGFCSSATTGSCKAGFWLIYAVDTNFGFSKEGKLPWLNLKCGDDGYEEAHNDMIMFKKLTKGKVVVMGRKTYESLPLKTITLPDGTTVSTRGLKGRRNIVISSTATFTTDLEDYKVETRKSVIDVIEEFSKERKVGEEVFVIGGKKIFREFIRLRMVKGLYYTMFSKDYKCDNIFREISTNDIYGDESRGIEAALRLKSYKVDIISRTMTKITYYNTEELAFIELLKKVYDSKKVKKMRASLARYIFSPQQLEFSLSLTSQPNASMTPSEANKEYYKLPVITHRKSSPKYVFDELMMICRGSIDSNELKLNVWKDNTSKEFLEKRGLGWLKEGELGATYGHQMRHFGDNFREVYELKKSGLIVEGDKPQSEYTFNDFCLHGYDQLQETIRLIKEEPTSNRIIIDLWNPVQLCNSTLPPCVYCYQFDVEFDKDNKPSHLNCKMIQRSSDIFLAGGWNITHGCLFTILMAKFCGLKPGKFIWSPANVHIYENNFEIAKKMLFRQSPSLNGDDVETYPFPLVSVNNIPPSFDQFKFEDLEVLGYCSGPHIAFNMNA